MNFEEKIEILFDYQKFEGEETLGNIIKDSDSKRRDSFKLLDDEDLALVSGGQDSPIQQYIVKEGDTLENIAAWFGTTAQAIVSLNDITEIKPGMIIIIS